MMDKTSIRYSFYLKALHTPTTAQKERIHAIWDLYKGLENVNRLAFTKPDMIILN